MACVPMIGALVCLCWQHCPWKVLIYNCISFLIFFVQIKHIITLIKSCCSILALLGIAGSNDTNAVLRVSNTPKIVHYIKYKLESLEEP